MTFMFALEVNDVTKFYAPRKGGEGKLALRDIHLKVEEASVFGLLGPNGAGKSTLINIIAGMVTKTKGMVQICGFDIDTHPRQAKQALGVVPQEVNIDPFFTPEEILENQAGFYGVPKKQRRTKEILQVLHLLDKRKAYVRGLSGGMKRRLLIAKALVHQPRVLILDEPTAGVDIELRHQMWNYVMELNKRGTTIILTTHYLEEAEELCDFITIINHGQTVLSGEKKSILQNFDQKQWIFHTKPRVERVEDLPPALLECTTAQLLADGTLQLQANPSVTPLGKLVHLLEQSGFCVIDVVSKETSLEEVFLRTTSLPSLGA